MKFSKIYFIDNHKFLHFNIFFHTTHTIMTSKKKYKVKINEQNMTDKKSIKLENSTPSTYNSSSSTNNSNASTNNSSPSTAFINYLSNMNQRSLSPHQYS